MKVLKEGRSRLVPLWLGKVLTCACGAKFQLEAGDIVSTTRDDRDGDYHSARCPTCSERVNFKKGA
jgi:DNA-directed RNA polymerase subunit RPC12/RpoP